MHRFALLLSVALSLFASFAVAQNCAGFTDVPASSPFCPDVTWITVYGITRGCAPGQFCPDENATRLQMAAFLHRMGEIPALTATQIIVVNKGGDDVNGSGSSATPFLSIGHALSVITDASSTKRYLIKVGPGTYAENVSLKANVFINGAAPAALTRVNSIDINDPSWTVDDDNRSGLNSIQVLGTTTLDFSVVQSHQGKVYLAQSRLSGDLSATAANSINEVLLYNCELQGNLTQQGGDVLWYSSTIFGNITIHDQTSAVNPIPNQQVDTRFFGSGGGSVLPLDGSPSLPDFTVTNDIASPQSHTIAVDLAGFAVSGTLTVNGDGIPGDTQVFATADGVPSLARLSLVAGASLVLATFANGVGYAPNNAADWNSVPPVSVQEALDRIAAKIGPIP